MAVGGSPAGVCAAVAAPRPGRTVALVHNRPVPGGSSRSQVYGSGCAGRPDTVCGAPRARWMPPVRTTSAPSTPCPGARRRAARPNRRPGPPAVARRRREEPRSDARAGSHRRRGPDPVGRRRYAPGPEPRRDRLGRVRAWTGGRTTISLMSMPSGCSIA
ncbi:FAD-dependent oxidoreductase [Streptomyces sp. NPDC088194]|uniref:FAD-dependent oxidoreductase n=1 Tax=Streptomyces sp. NPDC088194 TaxID=3154931 RepID=UPI00344EE3B9